MDDKMNKENFLRVFFNYKNEFKNGNDILDLNKYDWVNRESIELNIFVVHLILLMLFFLSLLCIIGEKNGDTNNINIILKYDILFFASLSFIYNFVYFIKLKKFKKSDIYNKVQEYFCFKNSIYYGNIEDLFDLNDEITKKVFDYSKDLIIKEYECYSGLKGSLILTLLYKTEYNSGKEDTLNKINASKNIEKLNNSI